MDPYVKYLVTRFAASWKPESRMVHADFELSCPNMVFFAFQTKSKNRTHGLQVYDSGFAWRLEFDARHFLRPDGSFCYAESLYGCPKSRDRLLVMAHRDFFLVETLPGRPVARFALADRCLDCHSMMATSADGNEVVVWNLFNSAVVFLVQPLHQWRVTALRPPKHFVDFCQCVHVVFNHKWVLFVSGLGDPFVCLMRRDTGDFFSRPYSKPTALCPWEEDGMLCLRQTEMQTCLLEFSLLAPTHTEANKCFGLRRFFDPHLVALRFQVEKRLLLVADVLGFSILDYDTQNLLQMHQCGVGSRLLFPFAVFEDPPQQQVRVQCLCSRKTVGFCFWILGL